MVWDPDIPHIEHKGTARRYAVTNWGRHVSREAVASPRHGCDCEGESSTTMEQARDAVDRMHSQKRYWGQTLTVG